MTTEQHPTDPTPTPDSPDLTALPPLDGPLDWEAVLEMFPYDAPRDVQIDGIVTAIQAATESGYLLMEGACGTGKTLIALAPYLALVNHPETPFERIVVVTSVKQQQRAFEDEIQQINEQRTARGQNPVSALTLVGKGDVCPYVPERTIEPHQIYDDCDRLRDHTAQIITNDLIKQKDGATLVDEAETSYPGDAGGAPSFPYSVQEIPYDEENGTEFCPFYAQHMDWKGSEDDSSRPTQDPVPFDLSTAGMLTPERLVQLAGQAGTCPHSVMGEALADVDIVIANYYHLFEPTTVEAFTGDLIDETSLLVVDEAHNLVPRVRELLNDSIAIATIQDAIDEAEQIAALGMLDEHGREAIGRTLTPTQLPPRTISAELESTVPGLTESFQRVTRSHDIHLGEYLRFAESVGETLDSSDVTVEEIEAWAEYLRAMVNAIDRKITDEFVTFADDGEEAPYEFDVALRDPERADKADAISEWSDLWSDPLGVTGSGDAIAATVLDAHHDFHLNVVGLEAEDLPEFTVHSVASFLREWDERDRTRYFQCVAMERAGTPPKPLDAGLTFDWSDDYTATLVSYNCIPRREISETLAKFGGGIMMSATLEPIHVYRAIAGFDLLEAAGVPVYERQFGLDFPEEQRMSFIVDTPAFKYSNKGAAIDPMGRPNTSNRVRTEYAQAIFDVIQTTPGNVLVCMPSYAEAEWAGKLLQQESDLDRDAILIDESSSNVQTERLKREFFESEGQHVLVTAAHGTLVEGVDYKSDRLMGLIVCGVPIENTSSDYSTAVQTAYEDEFGRENAFEYAFTVPAVHKVRQALGRVIRTNDDLGVRVLADKRYMQPQSQPGATPEWSEAMERLRAGESWSSVRNRMSYEGATWDHVHHLLSADEQYEFSSAHSSTLFNQLQAFWTYRDQVDNA